jgi:hypothetical protein
MDIALVVDLRSGADGESYQADRGARHAKPRVVDEVECLGSQAIL